MILGSESAAARMSVGAGYGEVGKVGVAIDSIEDMLTCSAPPVRQGLHVDDHHRPAPALLLLLYQLVGEEKGVDPAQLPGTIQNGLLQEYIARGTYI